jgi:monofunctional biosynthetic peptidoglycan transglycosylase
MKKEKAGKAWRFLKRLFLILFILQLFYIVLCRWVNPPITITQVNNILQGYGLQKEYISFDEMGSNIKLAVMASEDQLFPEHNGFYLKAIQAAEKYNDSHKDKRRGGSTISQQVAKNVFLWQGGGYFRKGLEFYFTFMIEKIWNKKRILETYLNVSEMGKGVFGVEAAAKKYFNKDAKELSMPEAAMIAACLPNPKEYTIKPLSRYVSYRYLEILRQMNNIEGDPAIKELIK